MKKTHYEVNLTIDGIIWDPRLVYPLYQSDPFPGGHQYVLTISGNNLPRVVTGVTPGEYENPDRKVTWSLFTDVGHLLHTYGSQPDSEPVDYQYFLNSIQSLSLAQDALKLVGECSEILKDNRG